MFYDKFNPTELTIKEFKHWIVVLRPKQQTLGDAVIILKEEHSSVGEVSAEAFAEFPEVASWYENKCIELFGAEKFNYNCAMMKDNFVHFHAFARYSSPRSFAGMEWEDTDWPRPISKALPIDYSDDVKATLLDAFRK